MFHTSVASAFQGKPSTARCRNSRCKEWGMLDHEVPSPAAAGSGRLGNGCTAAHERQTAVLKEKEETGAELRSCKWEAFSFSEVRVRCNML